MASFCSALRCLSRWSLMSFWRSSSFMLMISSPTSLPRAFICSLASWTWSSARIFSSFSRSLLLASLSKRASSSFLRSASKRLSSASSAAFFSAIKRSCSSFLLSITCFRSSADSWSRADAARAISNKRARFAARSGSRISSGLWSLAAWAASAT